MGRSDQTRQPAQAQFQRVQIDKSQCNAQGKGQEAGEGVDRSAELATAGGMDWGWEGAGAMGLGQVRGVVME